MYLAKIISKLVGMLADNGHSWVKAPLIKLFCRVYGLDIDKMRRTKIAEYHSFNDFFTRESPKPISVRPKNSHALYTPAEGVISQAGNHDNGQLLQAKGRHYNVVQLLAGNERAPHYLQGSYFVVYLAPGNYHRVHMPCSAQLEHCDYIDGALFPVNNIATHHVRDLFCRNERLICYFDCGDYKLAVIFVAAFLVGGISTVWNDDPCSRAWAESINAAIAKRPSSFRLKAGAELGRFYFGSTVVVLASQKAGDIQYSPEQHCTVGSPLAQLNS